MEDHRYSSLSWTRPLLILTLAWLGTAAWVWAAEPPESTASATKTSGFPDTTDEQPREEFDWDFRVLVKEGS